MEPCYRSVIGVDNILNLVGTCRLSTVYFHRETSSSAIIEGQNCILALKLIKSSGLAPRGSHYAD